MDSLSPLGATGPSPRPAPSVPQKADEAPRDTWQARERLGSESRFFTTGNKATPLVDGEEILGDTLDLIRKAREHVSLHLYDLSHPEILDALKEDAARGVRVRVLLDPAGSSGEDSRNSVIRKLRAAGVEVARFKVDEGKRQIDHVKLLIVDGREMIIGGMNGAERSTKNHDYAVHLEGRVLNYFNGMFETDWRISRGKEPAVEHPKVTAAPGQAAVSGAATTMNSRSMAAHIYRALDSAKKSIHLEMFFLSDRAAVQKLIEAHQRGVDVKVILDPSTVSWGESPNEETFRTLRDAGVDVRWFLSPKVERLHAKLGLIDGERTIIGSANWSYKALQVNHEAGVTVFDRDCTSRFERVFADDWENRTTTDLAEARRGTDPVDSE